MTDLTDLNVKTQINARPLAGGCGCNRGPRCRFAGDPTKWPSPLTLRGMMVWLFFVGLVLYGCAGQSAVIKKGTENTVYEMGQQEALSFVHWSMTQVLPDQNIYTLKKPRVGYLVHETLAPGDARYARFRETTYIYEVDLFLHAGEMPGGGAVTGYTYEIKGNGDLKTGPGKLAALERQLKAAFDGSGRSVMVSSMKPATLPPPAAGSGLAPVLPASPDAPPATKESPAKVSPSKDQDVFETLKKLKDLLDQGIITEEEFRQKKKELLKRI